MSDNQKAETVWAVRGIPEDLRQAVVARVKSEGRTVGAWVSDALRRALSGEALTDQLADLRRRVELLERRHCPDEPGTPQPCTTQATD